MFIVQLEVPFQSGQKNQEHFLSLVGLQLTILLI